MPRWKSTKSTTSCFKRIKKSSTSEFYSKDPLEASLLTSRQMKQVGSMGRMWTRLKQGLGLRKVAFVSSRAKTQFVAACSLNITTNRSSLTTPLRVQGSSSSIS